MRPSLFYYLKECENHSKGFAFIKMPVPEEAQSAVYALNNSNQDYYQVIVHDAEALKTIL